MRSKSQQATMNGAAPPRVESTEILVVGGSLGGVACALAALRKGRRVILTEEFEWLGGQLTSQAVPPDEHQWVEQFGVTRSYRQLRNLIRDFYRDHYPLTDVARQNPELNPGAGTVSRLCHEPRVAVAVIDALLQSFQAGGQLVVYRRTKPVSADMNGDHVRAVTFCELGAGGQHFTVSASFTIDATELGDLLPLTDTEYVTGFESRKNTGEPSSPDEAQPDNQQAFSVCFAVDHVEGDHTILKPESYDYWRNFQPKFWGGPLVGLRSPEPRTLKPTDRTFTPNPNDDPQDVRGDHVRGGSDLDLWVFRRIAARNNFRPESYRSDICLVNWPMIDYFKAPVIDVSDEQYQERVKEAAGLSYSMLYYLQTEAPRPDGGKGFPGLRLRGDITGTNHGLAMAPYFRESRRIKAVTTIVEQDVSLKIRGAAGPAHYEDSVGIGMYRIDLHPSTGGDNYIDVGSCPFEIPLGALIPVKRPNLLAGCKNIGTTHITNGCYRLHPVEWNIGEVAGLIAAHCYDRGLSPQQVQADTALFARFKQELDAAGIETKWPDIRGY